MREEEGEEEDKQTEAEDTHATQQSSSPTENEVQDMPHLFEHIGRLTEEVKKLSTIVTSMSSMQTTMVELKNSVTKAGIKVRIYKKSGTQIMMREAHQSMRVAHCSTMRQHRRQGTGGLGRMDQWGPGAKPRENFEFSLCLNARKTHSWGIK